MSQQLLYKIALTKIEDVGVKTAKLLVSYCGGVEAIFKSSTKSLIKIPGIGPKTIQRLKSKSVFGLAEKELKKVSNNNIEVQFYLDDNYPENLTYYDDAPIVLYVKKNNEFVSSKKVAIVGTRKPSAYGKLFVEQVLEDLKPQNIISISGLAHGIDTCAHKISLDLKIPTIGIMGHGFGMFYPAANRSLARKMINNGALVSEFGFDQIADKNHFPMRNRIIAQWCDVLIVVESARKGGSMITAEFANQYNKDVFAVPGKLSDEKSQGCNHLIKTHKAHLIESAKDISYIMSWENEQHGKQMNLPLLELDEPEAKIIQILKDKPHWSIDKLHYNTNMPLPELKTILLNLEFKGIIKALPGNNYILRSK